MTSAVEAENPEMTQFECWASVKEFLISHRSIFLPILMFFGFMGFTMDPNGVKIGNNKN